MPATAVGSEKGNSIIPFMSFFPGKSYRTNTQAMINPNMETVIPSDKPKPGITLFIFFFYSVSSCLPYFWKRDVDK